MDNSPREQRTALIAITGLATAALAQVWESLQSPGDVAAAMEDTSALYGLAAGTLAADWYESLRELAEVRGRIIAEPAQLPSGGLFRSIADNLAATGSPDTALQRAQGELQRVVANSHRDTITQLSGADRYAAGWRRVGDGDNCDFCRMLIGRGAVYKESTARFASHQHCNCMAAPAFDGGRAIGVMPYSQSTATRTERQRKAAARRVREFIAAN